MGAILGTLMPRSGLSLSFIPPPSKFDPARDIPDLSGKIALITGGNSGLGYETAKQLLLKGATVYIAARSPDKAVAAIDRLRRETGAPEDRVLFVKLDLADLKSVRAGAADFLAREQRLDILYNNGGVMTTPSDMLTAQNFDLQFGTNVLGHFFLTELLIPALRASHAASGVRARVVNLSSWGHGMAPQPLGFAVDTFKQGKARDAQIKNWGLMADFRLYGQSKLGNILISNYFARQYSDILVSTAVHPGFISTDLGRNSLAQRITFRMLYSASAGAQTQIWAGTTASAADINGQYLIPWARIAPPGVSLASTMSGSLEAEKTLVAWMQTELEGF
ncbi:NAD-P-binding protein [Mycena rosella]|uniref:NAD-P-binding protein n=1 Tax=Mycena rosella TaxID=1033263 RepID=A0AAD7DZY4_MYCRO|nr:NAD-P-binding protein [Mycena rosella]